MTVLPDRMSAGLPAFAKMCFRCGRMSLICSALSPPLRDNERRRRVRARVTSPFSGNAKQLSKYAGRNCIGSRTIVILFPSAIKTRELTATNRISGNAHWHTQLKFAANEGSNNGKPLSPVTVTGMSGSWQSPATSASSRPKLVEMPSTNQGWVVNSSKFEAPGLG